MEITYTLVGDYYLPNLVAPESPKVGRWECCASTI